MQQSKGFWTPYIVSNGVEVGLATGIHPQLKGRILTNKVEEYNIATLIHNVVPKVTIFGREGKKLGV